MANCHGDRSSGSKEAGEAGSLAGLTASNDAVTSCAAAGSDRHKNAPHRMNNLRIWMNLLTSQNTIVLRH